MHRGRLARPEGDVVEARHVDRLAAPPDVEPDDSPRFVARPSTRGTLERGPVLLDQRRLGEQLTERLQVGVVGPRVVLPAVDEDQQHDRLPRGRGIEALDQVVDLVGPRLPVQAVSRVEIAVVDDVGRRELPRSRLERVGILKALVVELDEVQIVLRRPLQDAVAARRRLCRVRAARGVGDGESVTMGFDGHAATERERRRDQPCRDQDAFHVPLR